MKPGSAGVQCPEGACGLVPHTTLNSRKGKCPKRDSRAVWVRVRLCTHMGLRLIHWGSVAMVGKGHEG